ncbi:MAG: hypothetical protein WCI36_00305 [bacterium]
MKEKHEKVFDPLEFENFVKTWRTARMKKDLGYRPLPPGFMRFREELQDDVLEILDLKKGISVKKCFCGKTPHSENCLIWPHLTATILDSSDKEACIHSLWLEPVEFFPTVKKEVSAPVEESQGEEKITVEVWENLPIVSVKKGEEKQYAFVLLGEGTIAIENAKDPKNPNFVFDPNTGQWLFMDLSSEVGEVKWFKNSVAAAMVIEANSQQLEVLIKIFTEILGNTLKDKVIKAFREVI